MSTMTCIIKRNYYYHEANIQGRETRISDFTLYQARSVVCPEDREYLLKPYLIPTMDIPSVVFRRKLKFDGKFFVRFSHCEQIDIDNHRKLYRLYMPYEYFSFRVVKSPDRYGFYQQVWRKHISDKFGIEFTEKMLSSIAIETWKQEAIKVFGKRIRITKAIERLTKKENECKDKLCHLDPQGEVEKAHNIAQKAILKSIKKGDD